MIPFDAGNSLLIELATKLVVGPHPMELDAEQLTDDEVTLLSAWVEEGARAESGRMPFAEDSCM